MEGFLIYSVGSGNQQKKRAYRLSKSYILFYSRSKYIVSPGKIKIIGVPLNQSPILINETHHFANETQ
jgi:hypothetical protein